MKQVLVVGGDPAYVRDTLSKKLMTVGLNVTQHNGWGFKGAVTIPNGCDGMVLLGKEASSGLTRSARSAARSAGIPLAECSERKFSHMLPALKMVGLVDGDGPHNIEKADAPVPDKVTEDHPSLTDTADWATLYLEDRPERTDAEVVTRIKKEKETNGFSAKELTAVVQGVRSHLISVWSKAHPNKALNEKICKIKIAWGVRFYQEMLQTTGRIPKHSDIKAAAKPIFGSSLASKLRTEILSQGRAATTRTPATPAMSTPPAKAPAKASTVPDKTTAEYKRKIQSLSGTINLLRENTKKVKDARGRMEAEAKDAIQGMRLQMQAMEKELETFREQAQERAKILKVGAFKERRNHKTIQDLMERNKALTTNLEGSRETVASVERANEMLRAENATLSNDLAEALAGAEKSGLTIDDLVNMGCEVHVKPPQK